VVLDAFCGGLHAEHLTSAAFLRSCAAAADAVRAASFVNVHVESDLDDAPGSGRGCDGAAWPDVRILDRQGYRTAMRS
jgi:hypothetical protein